MTVVGADAAELQRSAVRLRAAADELDAHARMLTAELRSVAWIGGASDRFLGRWSGVHHPCTSATATALRDAAVRLDRNAVDQLAASAGDTASVGTSGSVSPPGGLLDEVVDFLTGDLANLWNGDGELPLGQLAAGLVRVTRTRAWLAAGMLDELFPTFNTGRVGLLVANGLERVPGLASVGRWLPTPAATQVFRGLGVAGGVVSTGLGIRDLVRAGDPRESFERDGAGYVADWASTGFSASTTAFFVAPSPVTGALVIGTGLVWAGAEVVDHWDDITAWSSDVWDAGTGVVSGVWGSGTDVVADLWDASTDFLGDVAAGAGDHLEGIFG